MTAGSPLSRIHLWTTSSGTWSSCAACRTVNRKLLPPPRIFDPAHFRQDLLPGRLPADLPLELGVAQGEGETREELQVRPEGRTDETEEREHRLPVDGGEVDRPLQEAERDGGPGDLERDGIPRVGHRDAL